MPAVVLSNYTLAQVRDEVRTLIGDAPSLATAFSDASCNAAINFAVMHYFRITGKSYVENTLTKAGDTYPSPNSYIEVNRAGYTPVGGANTWLLQTNIQEETNRNPDWETLVGTPKRWMMFSGNKVRLTPNPPTGTCVIGYTEEPTNLSADNDQVDSRIPVPHQRHLKYAAAYWLLQIDGDTQDMQTAMAFIQQFTELIKDVS